jgi:hypothetical protein
MENYTQLKESAILAIEKAINDKFNVPYLQIRLIHLEKDHPNSYTILVDCIECKKIGWESMMYFQECDIDQIVDDLGFFHQTGEFLKDNGYRSEKIIKK